MGEATAEILDHPSEEEHDTARGPTHASENEELVSIALTSLAAAATAWSAFQASTWSGAQAFALNRALRFHQLASEARVASAQLRSFDASLFVTYAGAYAEHREPFATFLYGRFPPRLKKATDAWLATHPRESASAPPHPFAMPEYQVEEDSRAREADETADAAMAEGAQANRTADLYVLTTVLLSTIILVSAIGARLRRRHLRRIMFTLSLAALLGVLVWLALRPYAPPGVEI